MGGPAISGTHLTWELTGAGLDRLELRERPVPRPAEDQLLVRIDACGICFSDIKIVNLGPDHPRLLGRHMEREPVVMGHEVAMTVVEAGKALADRYRPGQRFLIQADVCYGGQGMAFGYRLPGGYSQYQLVGREILEGDEGCYLLEVGAGLSHAQAALCEPWACVEAAYSFRPRTRPAPGGSVLILFLENDEATDLAAEVDHLRGHRVVAVTHAGDPWLHDPLLAERGIAGIRAQEPEGFDDVLIFGTPNAELARHAATLLRPGGVFAIRGAGRTGPVQVDVGSIHYRGHWYTGAPQGDPYFWARTPELLPGGIAWFIGAGGPLGQMHLQRALSLPRPPAKILVSQRGQARIEDLHRRFAGLAASRGIEWVVLDAGALGDGVYAAVREETGGVGCDDICVIVPNREVIERAFGLLAHGGGMDIFAGVPVGTVAALDLSRVARDGVRVWGTSGSTIADLRRILHQAESGLLQTDRVVAAVGGIRAVKEGLVAVQEAAFLGKTLIYPHLDLPLLSVEEAGRRFPAVGAALAEGRYWTPAAERALLAAAGMGGGPA